MTVMSTIAVAMLRPNGQSTNKVMAVITNYVGQMFVGQMSVGQIVFDQSTWNKLVTPLVYQDSLGKVRLG